MSISNTEKEARVENLLQKLEEACSRAEGSTAISTLHHDEPYGGSSYVPTRIREIADQCLSPSRQRICPSQNNSALQNELRKAQDMLDQSRQDCKSLSTKYLAVSDKLKLIATLEEKVAGLILENRKLNSKIVEQEERHALHLKAYHDGQEKHSKLVLKLQNKVLQYKDTCGDLQLKLHNERDTFKRETGVLQETIDNLKEEVKKFKEQLYKSKEEDGAALKSALGEAESQEQRANQLFASNSKLRQQLEEMNGMNQRLSDDVHQLSVGWNEAQTQMKEKDEMWSRILMEKRGKSAQSQEACLKTALKGTSEVKEELQGVKLSTIRDLGLLKGELSVFSEQLVMRVEHYCGLYSNVKTTMTKALQQRDVDYTKVLTELNSLKCAHEALKTQHVMDKEERGKKIKELTSSLEQAEHTRLKQEKCMNELKSKLADMELSHQMLIHKHMSAQNANSSLTEDCETLKSALDEIVQLFVISGGDTPLTTTHQCSPKRPSLSPSALSTPPTICDCHGDAIRLKDWSVSMVKHGVDAREKEMKSHVQELSSMSDLLKGKQERIKLLEEEIRAHLSATGVMKSDLGMCHANNQELNKVKLKLEYQLEEMNLQKQQVEKKLTQTTTRLDSVLEEKSRKEASNASLEEAIANLRDQLSMMDQEKVLLGSRLASKDNESHHVELRLRASEEEVKKVRVRMSELELHKTELEKELNHTRMCVSKLELEKEELLDELRKVKESECTIMATLNELRMANTRLEADKRFLTQSLQESTSIKTKLDEENAKLEKVRFASEEQIQGLVTSARQLNEQITRLDKNLQEVEASKGELQIEKDRQCQEVAELLDSLNKAKETIAELQVQKGKLNSSITKLAREKEDLLQEKAELEKEKTQLQESLHSAEEIVKITKAAMERLEQRIEGLDKELFTSEQTVFKLQEANFVLEQEKNDMKLEVESLDQAKEQALSQLQNEKALELQQVLIQARGQENDLQAAIGKLESSCDRRMSELEELHAQNVALISSEHTKVVTQLQETITTLKDANKNELCHITFQKDQHISLMEKEKKGLQEQLGHIQELYADVCEKLHSQQAQSVETIAGLKLQLQASQSTAGTLEKELSAAEHHIHTLQAMLGDVKSNTDGEIDSLKYQLKTASETISTLEQTQDSLLIDAKHLKSKKEATKSQLDEAYRQLQCTEDEREALRVECQGLKQDVCSLREELASSKMAVTSLTETLSKTDDSRFQAEKDTKFYCASLLTLEQAHARLTSDHTTLQSVLTKCERNATTLQLELKECKEKGEMLTQTNEQLTKRVSSLEDHLKGLSNSCKQLEEENEKYRLRLRNVEEERELQKAAMLRLQEAAKAESERHGAEDLKLLGDLETCKKNCGMLRDEVAELEFELETSQCRCSDLKSKLVSAESLAHRYKDKRAGLMVTYKVLHEHYSELLSVLNGVLGLKLDHPSTEAAGNMSIPAADSGEGRAADSGEGRAADSGEGRAADSGEGRAADSGGYLSESGIEGSLDITQGSRVGEGGAPSSYGTQVRDAILALHKQVMEAHQQKCDSDSSSQKLAQKLKALEEEKASVEAQLKMAQVTCTSLNVSMEAQRKKHAEENKQICVQQSDKIQEAHLAHQHLQELSEKLAMEVSVLKSQNAAKEAELVQLQVKHNDLELRLAETQQQLVIAKESALVLDRSLNQITRKEAELVSKTHEREVQLERLRVDRLQLEERVTRHKEEIVKVKKDKDTLEAQLLQLAQSEDHNRRKAEALEHSVSDVELKKSEMSGRLRGLESQLLVEQAEKIKIESSLNEVQMEKKALETRLQSLEATLESATESSVASQQLCSSLERESHHLRAEVQRLREENERVMVELKAVQFQLQKVEQLQASKLSHRVLSVTQQNTELLVTVRSLKEVVGSKDEEYKQRLESMKKETEMLRNAYKSSEAQWKDKEKDYVVSIGQLERKVKSLEDKMETVRQKRTEYLERVREHEGSIPGMRTHQDHYPTPHFSAEGGAKCVLPVRLSEEAMRLKQSTFELLQSATPFLTPTHHQTTPLTSTPIKKT